GSRIVFFSPESVHGETNSQVVLEQLNIMIREKEKQEPVLLKSLDLDNIKFIGYAFQIEMKYKSKLIGFKITEVPILFADRTKGTSKMSLNIFHEAFLGVLKMRFSKK
ncbi:MAG: hypothetical protein ACKO8Q_03370, partial [Bacteroidota bacterium]